MLPNGWVYVLYALPQTLKLSTTLHWAYNIYTLLCTVIFIKMVNEIIKQCSDLSLAEIEALRYELLILYRDKFESMYKTVEIYPGKRIEEKIKKETGFHCYHKPCEGYSMGRGTHVIVIPIEKYSDDLKTELKSKYDY